MMKRGPRAGGLKKTNRGWRPRRENDPARAVTRAAGLSPRQRIFATEYLRDFNQTRAARAAGCPAASAHVYGSDIIRDPKVLKFIHDELVARRERAEVSVDEVCRYWYDLATADPRELLPIRRGCCRYCWGIDHDYQHTLNELRQLRRQHQERYRKLDPDRRPLLDEMGGDGYDRTQPPSPECPECHGEGVPYVAQLDLDSLSRGATLLLDGVDVHRDGTVKIRLRDRSRAMENLQLLRGMMRPARASWDLPVIDQMPEEQLDRMIEDARSKSLLSDGDLDDGATIEGEFSEAEPS